jgi:hypothetical protein
MHLGDGGLSYRVRVLIRHPVADPAEISAAMDMEPTRSWKAGSDRFTPSGSPLPGTHRDTMWAVSALQRNSRKLSEGVSEMVTVLEAAASLVDRLLKSGGTVELIVDLEGGRNIGDTLSAALLSRIAALGIEFGIEVFPLGLGSTSSTA